MKTVVIIEKDAIDHIRVKSDLIYARINILIKSMNEESGIKDELYGIRSEAHELTAMLQE